MNPFTSGENGKSACRYGLGEPGKFGMGDPGYSPPLNDSPDADGGGDMGMGTNPVAGLIGLSGWGATGVVDRLICCGVRFGLSFGEEPVDLPDDVELGLAMLFNQGLLVFTPVGVALRLVQDETEEAVGDEGPRVYQVCSSCRLTIDTVCCRLYCGLTYSDGGARHGELEWCCIAALQGTKASLSSERRWINGQQEN